jgi:adenylate cyclase
MGEELLERRLAAILAADIVGYSRLMEANEERTLGVLKMHRREFFDPTVAKHAGRIFKTMGDGFLCEFKSVLSATRCAVEIQRGMIERNAGVPEDRHIKFRIGINLGEIIVDGDDFYGDGVNLAARLEGLAGPGGIACSEIVRSQVGNKLELDFIDQGEKTVKNIAQPVRVYFVNPGRTMQGGAASATSASGKALLSEKPSIAVLPFQNMSNDPEQEFFSDGITEDIITDLSNVSGLFVLGRNTVFTYKGKSVNLEQAARDLGVAYLLEGSVRKAGNRVRINAQLIEGATGGHVWAQRFDRDLTDIFAIQDELTQTIVSQLKVKLLPEEKKAIELAPTASIQAYTDYLKGRQLFNTRTKAALTVARRMFARAVELDPLYARAYAGIADCDSCLKSAYGVDVEVGDILATADKALAIDPDLAEAHAARGMALMVGDRGDEAAAAFARALALDPHCYQAHDFYARFCVNVGDFERAAKHLMRALELQPDDYSSPLILAGLLRSFGRKDESDRYARLGLKRAEAELALHPENSKPAQLGAVALADLGESGLALEWLARALAIDPDDNIARYNAACTYSRLGKAERAFDLLESWIGQPGIEFRQWFLNDCDFDSIRDHPRYQKLLEVWRR